MLFMISATYIQVVNCACFYDVTFSYEIKDIVLNNYYSSLFLQFTYKSKREYYRHALPRSDI